MTRTCAARTVAILVLLGLAAGGPRARAEEPVEHEEPDRGDPIAAEIVVTARAPEETIGPAPGVLVLEVEQLRGEGDVTVADLLGRVPGINLQRRGSGFETATVRIRGSGNEQVLLLRDGRPLADSRSSIADLSRVSLEGVERIEVILGPATAIYGIGGAAGAINLVTGDSPGQEPGVTGSSRAVWGSFGEYHLEAGTTVVFPTERKNSTVLEASLSGVLAENTYSYQRAGSPETRENAGGREGSARVSLDRSWPNAEIGVDGAASRSHRGLPGTIEFPAVEAELHEEQASVRIRGGVGPTADDEASRSPRPWRVESEAGVRWSARSYRDEEYPLGTLESDSDLRLLHGTVTPSGPVGPITLRVPLSTRLETLEDTALGDRERTILAAAPAARSVIALKNRSEIDVNLHTRLESAASGSRNVLPSARAGIGWTAPELPLHLGTSLAAGYRVPDFSELFLERSAFAAGNPDLEPELSRGVDAEIKLGYPRVQPTDPARLPGPVLSGLGLRLAAHYTLYQDLIQWLPDPNGFWRPRNTGEALIYGGEAELESTIPLGLSPWTLTGVAGAEILRALDWNDGVTSGKQLPYRSQLSFNTSLGVEHLLGHTFTVSGEGRGARPVTRQNTVWLDPYVTLDAALRVAVIQRHIYLGGAVRNLLDEQFVETRSYPNPGREFRLSLEVRW